LGACVRAEGKEAQGGGVITLSYFLAGVIGAATVAAGACFGFVLAALLISKDRSESED